MAEDDSLLIKIAGWFLVVVVVAIIVYCWVVFVILVCVPLFYDYHWAWPTCYLILFHTLLFLVLLSYMRTIFTTSFVPKHYRHGREEEEEEITKEETTNEETNPLTSKKRKPRYCDKCEQDKPDRAHHCSRCGRCVLKMDHHCEFEQYQSNKLIHLYFLL